ncbi:MAG TPA: MFS transporter [Candidatus Dormibacteraeota bacterium]|nr:MFS transporter [Candidatus Dormibacteraeota bacterium]
MDRSLKAVLIGTFTLRFSTGLTGAMLTTYLAKLPHYHPDAAPVSAITVGIFAATFYVAELVLSPVFGVLSDRLGHHRVMLWGPIFGAIAVVLTALTGSLVILGATRLLEGSATAASIPSILGYIAIATAGSEALRGRAASRFEAATLAGIGAGFIVAPKLFEALGPSAFLLNAVFYGGSLAIYFVFVKDADAESRSRDKREGVTVADVVAIEQTTLRRYVELVQHSHVWLLAPTWIAVNAAIGLWFSQSLFQFQRSDPRFPDQWLLQGFSPNQITVGALVIAVIFGAGIFWWGNRFERYRRTTIILMGVVGGIALAGAGLVVNHTAFGAGSSAIQAGLVGLSVAIVAGGLFVLAGATPAAVGLLADVSEQFPKDRGAIMGLYSVFLGIGQIGGALLGGIAAEWRGMDGLMLGTAAILALALLPLRQLRRTEHYLGGPAAPAALG